MPDFFLLHLCIRPDGLGLFVNFISKTDVYDVRMRFVIDIEATPSGVEKYERPF